MQAAIICVTLCFFFPVLWAHLKSKHGDRMNKDVPLALLEGIEKLETYVRHQDERIKLLEKTVDNQQTVIEDLKKGVEKEKQQIVNRKIYTDSKTFGQSNKGWMAPVFRSRRAGRQHIAFSAYLDHVETGVQIDQIIKFNKVILNEGNDYSTATGIFSCSVTGTYLFTYTVNTMTDAYQLVVRLVLDGINESDGTSDPFHDLQHFTPSLTRETSIFRQCTSSPYWKKEIQGGNTVILHVSAGQSVWLAAYNTGNTKVDGRPDYRFSTFSGVLLYE